ncbi:MAG: glutamyl-tRNA(Gln) amidotransferase subunit A [Phycisphaerae bacterium]|nr:MAG: glutamyl-tRNA(Gln) amidotransferase subunit A [Phycisphaerae bacterium]
MTESARVIAADVTARRRSAVEIARATLAAIDTRNPTLNAFVETFSERTLAAAEIIDRRIAAGESLPLAGVPVALKDNLCLGPDLSTPGDGLGFGGRTTCASRILEHYRSPYTATAVQRLIDAGAVIVGKTNLDEFGMGSSTERSIFGPTRNPHDPTRVAGGSSGGSAAAVAAGLVPLALGSDTGGSIRQPASHCGVVGLKPTYGRVSRFGLVAYASSLDQIGPLAANVADAALALDVLVAHDPLDATSSTRVAPRWGTELNSPAAPRRVGIPRQARGPGVHPGVAATLERALERFRAVGAAIVEIDLPLTDHAIAAYYIIATAEASSNLARFDGVRYGRRAALAEGESLLDLYCRSRGEGFGDEVKRRILLGTHVLSAGYYDAYYATAQKVRRRVHDDYARAFMDCGVILSPAAPAPAFRLGEKTADPLAMYLEDVFTVGVNLAGLPAAVVPAGVVQAGGASLPVGVQLIAPAFEETRLLAAAATLEQALAA